MKSIINNSPFKKEQRRTAINLSIALCGLFFCTSASIFAASFGDPVLRSYLGQPLNAQIPLSGVAQEDLTPSCIQATVKTIDGDFITSPRVEFAPAKQPDTSLVSLLTREGISEPAITLSIALKCGSLIERNYSLLLDYAEHSAPAMTVATPESVEPIKATPSVASNDFVEPVAAATAPQQSTKPKKRSESVRPAQKTSTVNTSNKISKKPVTAVSSPKDQLKLSNEEVTPKLSTPPAPLTPPATPVAEKSTVDIEQQRITENNLAQQHFAEMLRDEPALLATQAEEAKKAEQQKIQRLEKELEFLKLQLQSSVKPVAAESSLPTFLIITNAVVLVLLLILLIIAGKLWLSLRKTNHARPLWWDATADGKQKIEEPKVYSEEKQSALKPTPEARDTSANEVSATFLAAPSSEPTSAKTDTVFDNNGDKFNLFTNRRGQSVQIEELSDFTQEAEFWVSINNPKRAIEILEAQSLNENLALPISSLYLLDLYRLVGDQEKYLALGERVKTKFNIAIPGFDEVIDQSQLKSLENYEHITQRCCAFWNTNYILPYLESLLIDDREGARAGFDLPVYRDILFLIAICKELDRNKNSFVPSSNP